MTDSPDGSGTESLAHRMFPTGYPVVDGHGLLDGKVAIVTAAAGAGIGAATATRCVQEGASVVIADHHPQRLERAQSRIDEATGHRPLAIQCDVTEQADVENLFAATERSFGAIDILVNNAGFSTQQSLLAMTDEEWHQVLDVNITGTMRCTRQAFRHFTAHKRAGVVINVASVVGWTAEPWQSHYAAAKGAVMSFTRAAAYEGAEFGIRVNAVAPTLVWNPFLAKVTTEEILAEARDKQLLKRSAHPSEVANVIVFLASDYSSYLSGEVLSVSAQHP